MYTFPNSRHIISILPYSINQFHISCLQILNFFQTDQSRLYPLFLFLYSQSLEISWSLNVWISYTKISWNWFLTLDTQLSWLPCKAYPKTVDTHIIVSFIFLKECVYVTCQNTSAPKRISIFIWFSQESTTSNQCELIFCLYIQNWNICPCNCIRY